MINREDLPPTPEWECPRRPECASHRTQVDVSCASYSTPEQPGTTVVPANIVLGSE